MQKTGRNDPCPCGSGKKYKQCCLKKQIKPTGKYTLPTGTQVDTYSQVELFEPLISSSKPFKEFYRVEKENIQNDFHWIKSNYDIEMSLGFRKGQMGKLYRAIGKNDVERFVVLEQIPPSLKDDYMIAHEIMHDIIFNEGFPGIAPRKPNPFSPEEYSNRIKVASALSSMIHDMLCDSRLKAYGFSFDELYKTKVKAIIANKHNINYNTMDGFEKLFYTYQHCLTILQGTLMVDNCTDELELYAKYYNDIFPEITQEGNYILELINDIGYNTPNKLNSLFQKIVERHNLEDSMQFTHK